jgi:3-dehydroshikimate dehydratase
LKWSLCSTGFKDQTIEQVLKIVQRLNLDGVELWSGHIEEYIDRHRSLDRLADLLKSYQISVPVISGYTYFSKSDDERNDSLVAIQSSMEYARKLNCKLIRTFAGHIASNEATWDQWKNTVMDLKQVMKAADHYEVNVAVEIHNNTYADNIESIRNICLDVDHPRLKLIFDGFNLFVDGIDQMEVLDPLYLWIDHVHLKNYHWDHEKWDKSIPMSILAGDVDNKALIRALLQKKYQGFLSFEYFGNQAEKCIADSLTEIKTIMTTR